MSCNSDSVVRTVYYKYLHPKEVFISHGILQKDFVQSRNKIDTAWSGAARSKAKSATAADVDSSQYG